VRGGIVVPEGTNTDQQGGAEPLPPDQQIQQQISLGAVKNWLGNLFGQDWETSAGGGGTGGQYMFTSLAELDAVIAQWKEQKEAIFEDGRKIRQAAGAIVAPAGDGMSGGMKDSSLASLNALYKHNQEMFKYADEYIKKLEASRASMANTDQSGKSTMDNVY
jgi:hypothetical protein